MPNEIEICNLALSNIRAGSINSLDEASVQAQQCKLKYNFMRDRCLRDGMWQFNRKIQPLASIDIDIFNWANSYSYPVDCLKIHRLIGEYEEVTSEFDYISQVVDSQVIPIGNLRTQIAYEIFTFDGQKVIGCNSENIRIDFAQKVTDPNLFSDDFIIALSYLLASELAISVVGGEQGRSLRSDSVQLYKEYINSALAQDLNDKYLESVESEFITVRR